MAARKMHIDLTLARGNALPKILAAVVVLALGGGAAWYFLVYAPGTQAPVTPTLASVSVAPTGTEGVAPAAVPEPGAAEKLGMLTVDQLFKEARTALNEQRLVAPPKNSALDFYLEVLKREPENSGAQDALRELFTFAASAVETDINARNLDEANRVIELLTTADPNNFTLTILRSKLDAQRKIVDREAAQAQAQADAAARRAAEPATASSTAATAATTEEPAAAGTAATPVASGATPPRTATSTAATTPPPPPVAPPKPDVIPASDAELVKQIAPQYPQAALRRRQEGWVEVEFTVTATGDVANAHVIDSDPPRTFDRAALDAVQRWNFKPATRNGTPTDATMRRRIEFKM